MCPKLAHQIIALLSPNFMYNKTIAYYDFSGHSVDHDIESNPSDKAIVDAFDDLGRIIAIDYIFK